MGDTNWTNTSGDGKASTNTNWTANAPDNTTRPVFSAGNSNDDCDWDITATVSGMNVDNTYTGEISLSAAMTLDSSPDYIQLGGSLSTFTTNNLAVDINSGYYCNVAGILNWGDSTVDITGAFNGSATYNIGAADINVSSDCRFGNSTINITGDATIDAGQSGGGTWNMNGASPTITITRPYNQTIQIDDPGTSTWIWRSTSNDDDTWNLGSGSFYNFTTDFSAAPSIRVATFPGGPAGPLDFSTKIDGNLTISGGTVEATSYTKLLLHCDGEDGGTTFMDDSGRLHTVTDTGEVHTDTTIKKFGTASAQFDGTGDYLTIASNGDFELLEEDFTIDMWINFGTIANMGICDIKGYADGLSFRLREPGGDGKIGCYLAGEGNRHIWTWTPLVDTWYHLALVRYGATLKCYVDGTALTATEGGDPTGQSIAQGALQIGQWLTGSGEQDFEGYIDEFRVTKGIARWTAIISPQRRVHMPLYHL